MSLKKFNGQEEQVNQIFERINMITGKSLPSTAIFGLIDNIIQMRAQGESETAISKAISLMTGIAVKDERIIQIIFEIEERPIKNTYTPFNNSLFADLKANLE